MTYFENKHKEFELATKAAESAHGVFVGGNNSPAGNNTAVTFRAICFCTIEA